MSAAKRQLWLMPLAGIVGLVLVCIGLSLAYLSNPTRFPLDVAYDRQIGLYSLSGLGTTIAGLLMVVLAAARTTADMPPQNRRQANAGVGLAVVVQLGGWVLGEVQPDLGVLAMTLVVAGLPLFVWGCGHYAAGKGHSSWLGALGLLGVLGLVVLIVLSAKETIEQTTMADVSAQPGDTEST